MNIQSYRDLPRSCANPRAPVKIGHALHPWRLCICRQNLCYVIILQNDVSQEDFIRGRQDMATENVFFCLADLANKHVETAKSLSKNIPLKARRCFLPLVSLLPFISNQCYALRCAKLETRVTNKQTFSLISGGCQFLSSKATKRKFQCFLSQITTQR